MKRYTIYIVCFISIVMTACMDDDLLWQTKPITIQPQSKKVYVINEGNIMYNNASISLYDIEKKEVENDVFYNINAIQLGDVAMSMNVKDSLAYIVLNNSGKINIVNINTFKLVGKITGLTSPRYIHFISDSKAYVSDIYAKAIHIVDLESNTKTGEISVNNAEGGFYQHPTEQMIQYDNYVFTNCWSFDNKVLIIDSDTDKVVDSIEVYKQPNSMVLDKNDKLWVLCDGGFPENPYGHEAAALVCIDAKTRTIEKTYRFPLDESPKSLCINSSRDRILFISKHVYSVLVDGEINPQQIIEGHNNDIFGGYYSVRIDPSNSEIYLADSKDNVQPGDVIRFTSDATPIDTFKVGIIPRDFCFR